MKKLIFASLIMLGAVIMLQPGLHQAMAQFVDEDYTQPYKGTELDQLTSNPKLHLVIVTNLGTIKLQLFDKIAPKMVANIEKLAKSGFYDGTTFHRCIPNFMIQGGDPNSKDNDLSNDGMGGSSPQIPAEFSKLHHTPGILSAARTQDPNSASCQFFICVGKPSPWLDNQYTIFGQVVSGMGVVNKIVALPSAIPGADASNGVNPGKASVMTKVTIEGE
jgi:cyclophilin family peptidyl-prolyl cis-trans isomerase